MKINSSSLPQGCALVDSLARKLAKSNELGSDYELKILAHAREAIHSLELTSRESVTGFPISDKSKVTPIVYVEDFVIWLRSWQCDYTADLKENLNKESNAETAPELEDKNKVEKDKKSTFKKMSLTVPKSYLVDHYGSSWPTLERDLKDANKNGLREFAKVRNRDWDPEKAVEWAKARNKFNQLHHPQSPHNTMANLPNRLIKGA